MIALSCIEYAEPGVDSDESDVADLNPGTVVLTKYILLREMVNLPFGR